MLDRVETFTTAYCLTGYPYLSAFWESGWIFAPAWHVTRLGKLPEAQRIAMTATISGKENERSAGTIKVVFELTKPK